MPELPEVECLARALSPAMSGRKVTSIQFIRADLRQPIPQDSIRQLLVNQEILSVERRSKYLLIRCNTGAMICHLGMTGRLLMFDSHLPQISHTHAIFTLSKKGDLPNHLHFVDPRRFGLFDYLDASTPLTEHRLFNKLGPEPLEIKDLGQWLWKKSRDRRQAIKPFLMTPEVVVGVGNIYASEALFGARIHPSRPAQELSLKEFRALGSNVIQTLTGAIQSGGTTFRDFTNSDGKPGYFSVSLKVYGRKGKPCTQCRNAVEATTHSGRSTFYCAVCQK